jgi:hypothetical protein
MTKKTILITLLMISMVTVSFAQMGRGRNARNWWHTFDVTNPVEISGEIVKVDTITKGSGRYGTGIHLTIADNGKESLVSLGPSTYLVSNNWQFANGEKIKIRAFKGTGNDQGQLFAAEITRGGEQLLLRDQNGLPMWRQSLNRRGYRRGGGRGYRR